MQRNTRKNGYASRQRSGFTLIELMVVITIIAALAALAASASLKFVAVQQTSNTQSTLDRVQSQLTKAWSKVKDDAYYRSPMSEIVPGTALTVKVWIQTNLAGADANATERVRVLYTKLKLRQAFPMSFTEALNPFPLPPLPAYQTFLSTSGITLVNANTFPVAVQSSACLLMALQRGVSGAGVDPSVLTSGGAAGSLPTVTSSIPYLQDAWARPIFFTRAPAGNLYLNPVSTFPNVYTLAWGTVTCYSQAGNNDPGDPQGLLVSTPWRTALGVQFATLTSEVVPLLPQSVNTSFKLAPLVASGGQYDWTKPGQVLPFDPITFFAVPGGSAQFSTP